MSRLFNVGDQVRFMMYSYDTIMRSGYLSSYYFQRPHANDEEIRLGAIYTILEIEQRTTRSNTRYTMYRLLEAGVNRLGWTSDRLLRHLEDVKLCPFHIGDTLRFTPVSTGIDLEVCPIGRDNNPFAPTSDRFTVRNVINDVYVQVDNEAGEESNFPFRWDDFVLCDH